MPGASEVPWNPKFPQNTESSIPGGVSHQHSQQTQLCLLSLGFWDVRSFPQVQAHQQKWGEWENQEIEPQSLVVTLEQLPLEPGL